MAGSIGSHEFRVTSDTRVDQLKQFLDKAGDGRLRKRASGTEGEVVLYVAPKPRFAFLEALSRLWNRRQVRAEEGRIREAIGSVFVRSLPAALADRAKSLRNIVARRLTTDAIAQDVNLYTKVTSGEAIGAGGRYSPMERFAAQSGEHTGGKTGSVKVKANGENFQLKGDVETATKARAFMERGLNVQLLGEVVGSAVLLAEQEDERGALPENRGRAAVRDRLEELLRDDGGSGSAPEEGAGEARHTATSDDVSGADDFPSPGSHRVYMPSGVVQEAFWFSMDTQSDETADSTGSSLPRDADMPDAPAQERFWSQFGKDAPDAAPQRAPSVTLLSESASSRIGVASKYLRGGKGDLEQYFTGTLGGTLPPGQHVKVIMGPIDTPPGVPNIVIPEPGKPIVMIQGRAAADLFEHLANTQLLRDADFNPAKFIVIEVQGELRLGCIDTAHSFGNLEAGRGNGWAWLSELTRGSGGRLQSDNEFIQGANRKFLRGNSFKAGGGMSKLWRDYEGLIPSKGYADALRNLAKRGGAHEKGLASARGQIASLVVDLQNSDRPQDKAKLAKLLKSLVQMANHDHHEISMRGKEPMQVVDEVFQKLGEGLARRREQAQFAGDLCEFQAAVNAHLSSGQSGSQAHLAKLYQAFRERHGDALKQPLVWFAESADSPPFKGTFEQYVDARMKTVQRQPQPASAQTAPVAPEVPEQPVDKLVAPTKEMGQVDTAPRIQPIVFTPVDEERSDPLRAGAAPAA